MSYVTCALTDRPVGLWMLDEPGGTVAKGLGLSGDAAYTATGVTYQVMGPSAQIPYGIATNGSTGAVNLPASLTDAGVGVVGVASSTSWEVWLNTTADITSATGELYGYGTSTNQFFPMGFGDVSGLISGEVVTASSDTNRRSYFPSITIPAGWHHHVTSYSGSQGDWVYFMDGIPRGSIAQNAGGAFGMGAGFTMYLARFVSLFSTFAGVAAAAVYPFEMSQADVTRHYQAGINGYTI